MNSAEFNAWCLRQNLHSLASAAAALGVPFYQLRRLDAGDQRINARIELACIGYEYCNNPARKKTGAQTSNYNCLLWRLIRQFLQREPSAQDEDLQTALVFGLAAVVGLERGTVVAAELLERADKLISCAPKWRTMVVALSSLRSGTMLRESDIERVARHMIATRGECAEGRAEKRAQDLANEGSRDGALIWLLVAERIKAIRSEPVGIEACQAAKMARGRFTVVDGGSR